MITGAETEPQIVNSEYQATVSFNQPSRGKKRLYRDRLSPDKTEAIASSYNKSHNVRNKSKPKIEIKSRSFRFNPE